MQKTNQEKKLPPPKKGERVVIQKTPPPSRHNLAITNKLHNIMETWKPKTDIYDRIKEAAPSLGILIKVKITPEIAKDLLRLNEGNRALDGELVNSFAEDMKKDKWKYAGGIINISKENKLLDGQKRLMAIVESNTTQVLNIQCGLDKETFAVMDTGKSRSASDVLYIEGFSDSSTLAGAIKADVYFVREGRMGANISRKRVANHEVRDWPSKNKIKTMVGCVIAAKTELGKKASFISLSTWAFIYYQLIKVDRTDADKFVRLLSTGENLSSGGRHQAIYFLREKLLAYSKISSKIERFPGGSKTTEVKVRYIFRAWNLWRANTKIDELKINIAVGEKVEKPL